MSTSSNAPPDPAEVAEVYSEEGYYAVIPEWVLDADISALASSSLSFTESAHGEEDLVPVARERFRRGFEDFFLPFLRLPRNPDIREGRGR